MYSYLQNVKINVSNAIRKRPKVIKSLKLKFFIASPPFFYRMKASPPCNTTAPVTIYHKS